MSADPVRSVPLARPDGAEAFRRAVAAARHAPSAHNAQPWRWRLAGDILDLFLEPHRMADTAEPDERLAVLGCGAALHHARLALAAQGWRPAVNRQPDPENPHHIARLGLDAPVAISDDAVQAARLIVLRHTDTRAVMGRALRPPDLKALAAAVEPEGSHLHVLSPDQILRLVLASAPADDLDPVEAQWHDELARWSGRGRTVATGHDLPVQREPGSPGRAATFAVLHGPGDERIDWLRSGEALSAGWLLATEMQVSVVPFSAPIERAAARAALRSAFGEHGHPHLVLRLGRTSGSAAPPGGERLPLDRIFEAQPGGGETQPAD